ncbi:hypothetical_protein_-_conserved [Leishmania infantum]|uniref:Hypothetical_protein_-_conserved n=1 Tax=Leishmania infantum TaxID=5671 RepID=A0A6L0XP07_LEIIN|nr:hypothetical_protein_-_conserved [Leishmania infantum]SUZ41734.1 hypothetical_protein_-_conserved [Leishmania infantum]
MAQAVSSAEGGSRAALEQPRPPSAPSRSALALRRRSALRAPALLPRRRARWRSWRRTAPRTWAQAVSSAEGGSRAALEQPRPPSAPSRARLRCVGGVRCRAGVAAEAAGALAQLAEDRAADMAQAVSSAEGGSRAALEATEAAERAEQERACVASEECAARAGVAAEAAGALAQLAEDRAADMAQAVSSAEGGSRAALRQPRPPSAPSRSALALRRRSALRAPALLPRRGRAGAAGGGPRRGHGAGRVERRGRQPRRP